MIKIINITLVLFCFALTPSQVFAAEGGEKGASEKAFEHANEQSIFHRVGDWFTTVGKSPEEKEHILEKRKEMKEQKRIEKEAKKLEKKSVKKMEKQKEKVEVKGPEKSHGKSKGH